MRPLKLTMSAFGSYAGVETIDFTKLGENGLYMIAGETGAGKTTIFDAISFALYGKASGQARDGKMLRSDFADDKTKTFAELDFAAGEKKYRIRRDLDGAALMLSDGTVLSGVRAVKDKVSEIIGLERDQFAQIVMIAQNDFLRFLQSGTDERVQIMRRIFGTEMLKRFQESLKEKAKESRSIRDSIYHEFERYGVDPYGREKQFTEWERQIESDRESLAALEKELKEYDRIKTDLAGRIAVAEDLNKKFSDFAACGKALSEHKASSLEISTLAVRCGRGEAALRRVKPLADKTSEAKNKRDTALTELANAKRAEGLQLERLERAKEALDKLPPLDEKQAGFDRLKQEWERASAKLIKLNGLQSDHIAITDKQALHEKAKADFERLNADFAAADGSYKALEEAFLRGQAGILASKLRPGEPCPVCGSKEHPCPTEISRKDLNEAKVKEAKDAAEKVRARRDGKSADCAALNGEIDIRIKRFIADFSEFVPDTAWDAAGKQLTDTLAGTRSALDELSSKKEAEEKSLLKLTENWEACVKEKNDSEAEYRSAVTLAEERGARERESLGLLNEAESLYRDAIRSCQFADETDYLAALVTEDELSDMKKRIADHEKAGEQLERDLKRLEAETKGKERPDPDKLKAEITAVAEAVEAVSARRDETKSRLDQTADKLKYLRRSSEEFDKAEKEYAAVRQLSETANGKLDFETYAQLAYFERVLRAANRRLKIMSQNRYTLLRKQDSGDRRSKMGLELEVADSYTGKPRSANSLSGGESFMASLSLALGLSDVVQQSAGGVRLDAMFIDEGFGSLDSEVLELAIRTLQDMAGCGRMIGVISHVAELRERIEKQIFVEKTTAGSRIKIIV